MATHTIRISLLLAAALLGACSHAATPALPGPPPTGAGRQPVNLPQSLPVTFDVVPIEERELIAAINAGDVTRARTFLDAGGDPNARSVSVDEGTPAIGFAIDVGRGYEAPDDLKTISRTFLRLLLEHGADPNIRWCDVDQDCDQTNGITPLMYAVVAFREDVVPLLQQFGADPDLRDWHGLTAADYLRGVRMLPGSLCSRPGRREPHLADARRLAAGDSSFGDVILRARGPGPIRRAAVIASTDDVVCETAARAAAPYLDEGQRIGPRQLRPVLVFHVGMLWMVGEPGRPEQGYFDEMWRLVDWYPGPS